MSQAECRALIEALDSRDDDDDEDFDEDDDGNVSACEDEGNASEVTVYASQGVVVVQPSGRPEDRLVYTEGQASVLARMLRVIEASALAKMLDSAAQRSHLMAGRSRPGRMY